MDELILILLFVIVFIGVPVGFGWLLFYIPKRLGYLKTGKFLVVGYSGFLALVILAVAFEDELFTKNDAQELLIDQGIVLTDEFTIEENESMSAIGDYYHTFTLIISKSDKQKAIFKIKNSEKFLGIDDQKVDLYWTTEDKESGTIRTQNYEDEDSFVTEYLEPNGPGYAPTYRRITIFKESYKLTFEDIDY